MSGQPAVLSQLFFKEPRRTQQKTPQETHKGKMKKFGSAALQPKKKKKQPRARSEKKQTCKKPKVNILKNSKPPWRVFRHPPNVKLKMNFFMCAGCPSVCFFFLLDFFACSFFFALLPPSFLFFPPLFCWGSPLLACSFAAALPREQKKKRNNPFLRFFVSVWMSL